MAGAVTVGKLVVNMAADVATLKTDMSTATRIVETSSKQMVTDLSAVRSGLESMMNPLKNITAAFGPLMAAVGGLAITDKIRGVITGMAELGEMARKTGASVESLSALKGVAKSVNGNLDDIGTGLAKLSKNLVLAQSGSDAAVKSFAMLKLDPSKFQSSEEAMLGIAQKISGLSKGYEQVAAAQMFFGKNGAALLPVLLKLAETGELNGKVTKQQADEAIKFEMAMAKLGARFNGMYVSIASGLLPTLVKITDGFGAFISIGAAYIAAFTIAPAVFTAATVALGNLQMTVALAKLEMAQGATFASLFSGSIGGIVLPAEAAAGALGVLKIAAGGLFAVFAGWQIGTWLHDQFVEARIAGATFVGITLTGWENVKYGAQMAWEGIKFAWDATIGAMKASFADYISSVAKGLSFVGASDTSKQVQAYADSLSKSTAPQKSFVDRTASITAAHKKAVDAIDENIVGMVQYEMAMETAKNKQKAVATGHLDNAAAASKAAAATESDYSKLIKSINEKTAANEQELAVGHSLSESEKIQTKMRVDLASGVIKLTSIEQSALDVAIKKLGITEQQIAAEKYYAEQAKARYDASSAAIKSAMDEADRQEELVRTFGMTKTAIEQMELARLQEQLAQAGGIAACTEETAKLEALIDAKKRSIAASANLDGLEAAKKAAADVSDAWQKSADDINKSLSTALMNGFTGAKGFAKDFVASLKGLFAKLVLQPILAPISAGVASLMNPGAAQAQGISGGMDMLSTGKSLWDGFSGGMAASMGNGIGAIGTAIGSSAVAAFGTGMTMSTASAAAATATGSVAAGVGVEGAAGAAMSAGASVASAIPYVAAALAVAYVLKKGFGHGERETTSRGIEGSFGGSGFTGNNYNVWKEKGGWFTGDNNGRDTSALDSATAKQFSAGYAALQTASINAATALGLSADSIASYSEKISITLTDDAKKNEEVVTKVFADLGNNLATTVAPGIASLSKDGETASTTLARLSGSITTANAWLSMLKQRLFSVSLAGGDAASKLADAFGGLQNLTTASKAFCETYYTEGERAARSTEDMTKALAAVNLSMPATKDELRSMAASLDLNTESGRAAYATLLAIAPEFANVATITAKMAQETAANLMTAFTGNGLLLPALNKITNDTGLLTSNIDRSSTSAELFANGLSGGLSAGLSGAQIKASALASGAASMGLSMDEVSLKAVSLSSNLGGNLAGSMTDTQVRALALATGFTEAQVRAGSLTDSIWAVGVNASSSNLTIAGFSDTIRFMAPILTGAASAAENVGLLFTGAQSGLLSFGSNVSVLSPIFDNTGSSAGNVATALLNAEFGIASFDGATVTFGKNVAGLTPSINGASDAVGSISTRFLAAQSGLISFGGGASTLQTIFTGAQLAGLLLNNEINDLRLSADKTQIDIAGLGAALANVNTETFIATIGLVFANLATRIRGVLDGIASERIAVREAALQIINPTVMSKAAIQRGIASVNTSLPSNAGVSYAQWGLGVMDKQVAAGNANLTAQRGLLNSYSDQLSANKSWLAQINNVRAAENDYANRVRADLVDLSNNRASAARDALIAKDNGELVRVANDMSVLNAQANTASANINSLTGSLANQQGVVNLAVATTNKSIADQGWWVNYAKQQQLSYANALQDFAVDASKSVGKLSKLREETVKYYDAQKQLADLMGKSAAGLRSTVSDYRYNQMSPQQQFDKLQSDYATAYSMALSTDGEALAGYGDKLNSLLNPMLEKAKEALGSGYDSFASTAVARAEAVAGRLEALTPTNYAADSLAMLGQIDSTLAALDASSRSAEKIISDAVNAGSDKTAAGLRAVIAALTGKAIPAFATGGDHLGGLRIVGENGPELEATGPSRIFNASQTRSMLAGGGSNAEMVAELRALRAEVANLRIEARATAANTGKMSRLQDWVMADGQLIRTDADAPIQAEMLTAADFAAAYAAA